MSIQYVGGKAVSINCPLLIIINEYTFCSILHTIAYGNGPYASYEKVMFTNHTDWFMMFSSYCRIKLFCYQSSLEMIFFDLIKNINVNSIVIYK